MRITTCATPDVFCPTSLRKLGMEVDNLTDEERKIIASNQCHSMGVHLSNYAVAVVEKKKRENAIKAAQIVGIENGVPVVKRPRYIEEQEDTVTPHPSKKPRTRFDWGAIERYLNIVHGKTLMVFLEVFPNNRARVGALRKLLVCSEKKDLKVLAGDIGKKRSHAWQSTFSPYRQRAQCHPTMEINCAT